MGRLALRLVALAFVTVTIGACWGRDAAPPGMALVPAGEFSMGSLADDPEVLQAHAGDEQPQHPVDVGAFYLDLHEVTNAEFEKFRPDHTRHGLYSPCDQCPVVNVSWFDAKAYCEAQKKRLPSEAEWEKAAKGGVDGKFKPFEDYAWYQKNAKGSTQPVAQKRPNAYGLYDMLGNVREWTADWFDPTYYKLMARDDPKGPAEGKRRVERGGAFFLPRRGTTATIRYNHPPEFRLYFLGFRCAKDA